jgi:hypothetical protein
MVSSRNSIYQWCAVHSKKSMINTYSDLLQSPSAIVRVTGSIHHLSDRKYFHASTVEVVEDLEEQVGDLDAVVHEEPTVSLWKLICRTQKGKQKVVSLVRKLMSGKQKGKKQMVIKNGELLKIGADWY